MRSIDDIMNFRTDISPFLVHLTRMSGEQSARTRLESIIGQRRLKSGPGLVSHASYGFPYARLSEPHVAKYFHAICFTETPLNQIHCLLDVEGRSVNLEPYGLVFLRQRLQERGVAPVLYFNNELGDKPALVQALTQLIDENPDIARQILPFIAVFGRKLPPACQGEPPPGRIDFLWEREWRWPRLTGDFSFDVPDVFIGLCPHNEICHFESMLHPIRFVDPRRNMRWYSAQLIEMRQRLDLTQSVV